jgi:chitinase
MSTSVIAPSPNGFSRLGRLAALSTAFAAVAALAPTAANAGTLAPQAVHGATTCQPWSASTIYVQGDTATENGVTYLANYWTQGDDPATHNGPAGSGAQWTVTTSCGAPPPPPPPAQCDPWSASVKYTKGALVTEGDKGYKATEKTKNQDPATNSGPKGSGEPWMPTKACQAPPPPPPGPLVFGSYKDITVNLDWNTNVLSTAVTGSRQPVLSVMPAKQTSATWAFASGECGSENWAGVSPSALVAANVSKWVAAGKKYIISTGGAAGTFTCGSDAGFEKFISTYDSTSLQGIDFDIEGGQSQSTIDNLVARVKTAQGKHPNLRFSFTIATLGGNSPNSLNSLGAAVMNSIKAAGLTNYYIDLMTMDYGSANASNCTLGSNGRCDMGQSAINAAINLHNFYGTPYTQIEITPMIGGNDAQDEVFSLADVDTLSSWALTNKIAGIHFWSLDRDNDCPTGSASATCNSYGQAGTWGFTNRFISKLGL